MSGGQTAEENRRYSKALAKTAQRSVSNEAMLVWAFAGIALFLVLLFWLPAQAIDRLSLTVDPMFGLVVIAAFLAGLVALAYERDDEG